MMGPAQFAISHLLYRGVHQLFLLANGVIRSGNVTGLVCGGLS